VIVIYIVDKFDKVPETQKVGSDISDDEGALREVGPISN